MADLPRSGGPRYRVSYVAAKASAVAHDARAQLEGLADRLKEALDAVVEPVVRVHDSTRGVVWQIGHERDWAEARAGRGAR